jgi:hypothetical protein
LGKEHIKQAIHQASTDGRALRIPHRKVGPGDVFLITIRHGFQKPVHFCFRPSDTTLPKLEDTPPLLEQLGFVPKVSLHILVEFQSPEFFASSRGCGISAARVSVPEAAMNENADVVARKHYVWPTWKLPRVQSIPEAMPMQQLPDLQLGRCIAAANSGHHARPDLFADYVHDRAPDEFAVSPRYSCRMQN